MFRQPEVVIIGGGHVGKTLYVDLKWQNEDCDLAVISESELSDMPNSIEFRDLISGRIDHVSVIHHDFYRWAEAESLLRSCRLVFVTIPDIPIARRAVMDALFRNCSDKNLTIVFIRAGQGGALWLSEKISCRAARLWNCLLVEDSPYGTRYQNGVIEYKRKVSYSVAHYGPDYSTVVAELSELLPRTGIADLIRKLPMSLLFDPLGYYIHTAVALDPENLHLTFIGQTYLHYSEGISRHLAEVLNQMDEERVALAASFGVEAESFPEILLRQYGHEPRGNFFETMQATGYLYKSRSATSIENLRTSRMLHEDIPALKTIQQLAAVSGTDMRATNAFAKVLPERLRSIGLEISDLPGYTFPEGIATPDDARRLVNGFQA